MTTDYAQMAAGISRQTAALKRDIPETMSGFYAMAGGACAPGELDATMKEYLALGIAVATRCDPCIAFHTRSLVKMGVSRAAFEEVLGIAVYMGGGPSLMYSAHAMEAFDQFSEK